MKIIKCIIFYSKISINIFFRKLNNENVYFYIIKKITTVLIQTYKKITFFHHIKN